MARRSGYRILEGDAHIALAGTGPDRAHARLALDLHRDTGHRLGQARTLVALGAREHWAEALEIFTACGAVPEAHTTEQLLSSL